MEYEIVQKGRDLVAPGDCAHRREEPHKPAHTAQPQDSVKEIANSSQDHSYNRNL